MTRVEPPSLRFGLTLPTWPVRGGSNVRWHELRALARDAEAAGIDTLWVPDHLQRVVRDRPPFGFWEAWTILTAVADATVRVELGPLVLATAFRNPGLVAKMAATLDEVSGGRLILGLGSGDPGHDASWDAFGYDAPRAGSRHREAVEVIARLLREPPLTFSGEFHRTNDADILPRGPRAGGPPIWVAAKGDRAMLVAARWGDAVNVNVPLVTGADVEGIRDRVTRACEEVGRDPGTLAVTGWGRIAFTAGGSGAPRDGWVAGSPEQLVGAFRAFAAAGLRHLSLYVGDEDDPSPLPALSARNLERVAALIDAYRTASTAD